MFRKTHLFNLRLLGAVLITAPLMALLPIGLSNNAQACMSIGLAGYSFGNCGGIADSLCKVVGWFITGDLGKAIASFTIIFLGLQAFFGKLSWSTTVIFTVGIITIFAAQEIVGAITGVPGSAC